MKRPRRSLLVQTCLAVAVGLVTGQAVAAVASSGTTARTPSSTADVRIATYNVAAGTTVNEALTDVTRLANSGADIIALQEIASAKKRQAVREAMIDCSMCAFEGYMPRPPVEGSTPILYRWEMFRLEDTGTVQVSEDTFVGREGAGPSTLRAKFINYVRLRERATGQTIYVLNNHAVPSVQGPDGGRNHLVKRHELYEKHMDGLADLVNQLKATGATVVVTGDLNVNYRKDKLKQDPLFPYKRFNAMGVKSSFQVLGETARGTTTGKARRIIDYVAFTQSPGVVPRKQFIPLRYHSDHRPLFVDFTFKAS